MRLVTYLDELDLPRTGVVVDDDIVGLDRLVAGGGLRGELAMLDVAGLLAEDEDLAEVRAAMATASAAGLRGARLDAVRLVAPILPGKVICVGHNYAAHVREQGLPMPDRPTLFAKFANAVIGDGEAIVMPATTHALDLEAELAVVIGQRARRVLASEAPDYVFGYTAANDVSARDLQGSKPALRPGEHGDGQWLRAKGSDTFLPLGPAIVSADELGDAGDLRVRSWRVPAEGADAGREVPMQDARTSDLIFDVARLVEFVSESITLEAGDLIVTGTPSGVGVFRDPPVFLQPGDVVRIDVERIGSVTNPVVGPDGTAPPGSPASSLLASRGLDGRGQPWRTLDPPGVSVRRSERRGDR